MGLLSNTRVYTVGSMQYENGEGWRKVAEKELGGLGITVFNPYTKPFINQIREDDEARAQLAKDMKLGTPSSYDRVAVHMKHVRSDDLRLCDISDFFIVYINPKIATWGSAEELTTANRMKKPVFIFVEGGKTQTPLWVMGMIPHKYIYNSLDEILNILKKIDSGDILADSGRWRLLQSKYR